MLSLRDRLGKQVDELVAEKARIESQAAKNIAEVDAKLAVLAEADKVVTKEVEQAYVALLALGLVREI